MFSSLSSEEVSPDWLESPKGTSVLWRKGRSVCAGRLGGLVEGFGLALVSKAGVLKGMYGLL
jgi:hypothetical protein